MSRRLLTRFFSAKHLQRRGNNNRWQLRQYRIKNVDQLTVSVVKGQQCPFSYTPFLACATWIHLLCDSSMYTLHSTACLTGWYCTS